VIVNPTRVYGPGLLTEGNVLTELIDQYDRGRVPILFNRGVNVGNYVMVDDVARGHILAMERGRIGQKYILGGENASLLELFRTVDRVSGKRHFQIPLFKYGPLVFAKLLQKRAEWFGVYPKVTPGWVETFSADWACRSDKARSELGYVPTPLQIGIEQTYRWIMELRQRDLESTRLRRAIRRGRRRVRRAAPGLSVSHFASRELNRR
jgi:farnesol dehydrogenase